MDQVTGAFTFEFLPRGFLQMIYVDLNGLRSKTIASITFAANF